MKSELISIRPDARVESKGCHGTLEREEWRPVKGYEGLYEVSSFGRVRSLDRWVRFRNTTSFKKGQILKQRLHKLGYYILRLANNQGIRASHQVHRLVMSAFVPNPDNLPMVNHRNEVKTSNYPDNMEWCDAKYNVNYGTCVMRGVAKRKGMKRTKETCEKISISNMGKKRSPETCKILREKSSKPVLQCDLEGRLIAEWESMKVAQQILGIWSANISKCCKGKVKTAGGFIWRYKK